MPTIHRPTRRVTLGLSLAVVATIVMITPGYAGTPATGHRPATGNLTTADPSTPGDGTVRLVDKASNLCLSPAGGRTELNNPIVQYFCDADPSRLWTLQPTADSTPGDEIVQVRDMATGLCLSPAGGSLADQAVIVEYLCDGDAARQWVLDLDSSGVYTYVGNMNSGLCLTLPGEQAGGLNTEAVQSGCDADAARWSVSTGDLVRDIHSGLCLNPTGTGLNAAIVQAPCTRAYRVTASGTILDTSSGLCLSPAGGSTALNVVIVQYYCDGNPSRSWSVTRRAGYYQIRNNYSGLCLSPAGGSATAGAYIVQYNCDGTASRLWYLSPQQTIVIQLGKLGQLGDFALGTDRRPGTDGQSRCPTCDVRPCGGPSRLTLGVDGSAPFA
jgi:hypothetical protein